ncbi:hypothetical protein N7454_006189 [Penicillium verhagenii]|nr:hypothetical protein N7454_006189 [Penicillium verhagenii]
MFSPPTPATVSYHLGYGWILYDADGIRRLGAMVENGKSSAGRSRSWIKHHMPSDTDLRGRHSGDSAL